MSAQISRMVCQSGSRLPFALDRVRTGVLTCSLFVAVLVTACAPMPAAPNVGNPKFDDHRWSRVADGAPWGGRAGAEAVYLDGSFYLVGGRTPNRPTAFPQGPIPGDSKIWGDVWRSDDGGKSWTELLRTDDASLWPARSYHEVVVHNSKMVLLGGQNFILKPNPACTQNIFCFPRFVSRSDFFNDVWSSRDGVNWEQLTAHAPWVGRAGLSAAVLNGEIYVLGGSVNDDVVIVGGPPKRKLFNDVWKSADGVNWEQVSASAPWAARAGAAVVVKDGYLYVLGGEYGFLGTPPPYFNDVWRTQNGSDWELVTASAAWSPRPGHTCDLLDSRIVCFGGYGQSPFPLDVFGRFSPTDVWSSEDGAIWDKETGSPWNAKSKDGIRYDYDSVVAPSGSGATDEAIFTFGGDRETFNFFDPTQWRNVEDDVWRFALQP